MQKCIRSSQERDEYEQYYYREWSHELPPLRHTERGTVVDLHHNILPTTARLKPEARKLIQWSQPMPDSSGFHTLCPEDTILHRAAHLFFDGDLQNSLRELLDIHELISTYGDDEGSWLKHIDQIEEEYLFGVDWDDLIV